jgi:hypothetical protein
VISVLVDSSAEIRQWICRSNDVSADGNPESTIAAEALINEVTATIDMQQCSSAIPADPEIKRLTTYAQKNESIRMHMH